MRPIQNQNHIQLTPSQDRLTQKRETRKDQNRTWLRPVRCSDACMSTSDAQTFLPAGCIICEISTELTNITHEL